MLLCPLSDSGGGAEKKGYKCHEDITDFGDLVKDSREVLEGYCLTLVGKAVERKGRGTKPCGFSPNPIYNQIRLLWTGVVGLVGNFLTLIILRKQVRRKKGFP